MELILRDVHVWDDLIEGPMVEPIDLDEVKRHLRFDPTSEDTLIDTYIAMARQYFEHQTGRQLIEATYERRIEGFPVANTNAPFPVQVMELAHPPLLEVVSVTYATEGSPAQTPLAEGTDYEVHRPIGPYAGPGVVAPLTGSWPTLTSGLGTVRIRYKAGYGSQPGDVPELIRGALYFLVGHFHKYRAEVHEGAPGSSIEKLPLGAEQIIRGFQYASLRQQPPMKTTWG